MLRLVRGRILLKLCLLSDTPVSSPPILCMLVLCMVTSYGSVYAREAATDAVTTGARAGAAVLGSVSVLPPVYGVDEHVEHEI